jgi:hypothetical protein
MLGMNRAPGLYNARQLMLTGMESQAQLPNGCWVPARPLGLFSFRSRLRLAWMVFTGRADALVWPGQR